MSGIAPKYDSVDLTWNNVRCSVESKVEPGTTIEILKDVSGYARAGKMTSIMGPSGAGKTTMMDLLAGRLKNDKNMSVAGEVLVNDKPVDALAFRKVTAYVQQQDHLPPTESVRECLMFSAQLRLPRDMSREQKKARVDAILHELGLNECADTLVGSVVAGIKGISGGEKRRTSVAIELVTSPKVLFLDEPTSGLDSEIAVSIMRTLKKIAAAGRTVALTIHQPNSDITEMFDDFILMAKGKIMYGGPWSEAVTTFASAGFQCPQYKNPTDYFMAIASEEESMNKMFAVQDTRWASTKRAAFTAPSDVEVGKNGLQSISVEPGQGQALAILASPTEAEAPWWSQLFTMIGRNLRAWRRHPIMLVGEAVQYIFLSLFVGGLFFDVSSQAEKGSFERGGATFFMLVTIAFTPPFTTVTVYQTERKLVLKEVNQNVYSLSTYFWGKTLTLFPVEAVFSCIVSLISYFMFGFQNDFVKWLIWFLTILLTLLVSESIGMLFAMVTVTADLAIVFMSIIFILLLALTGFLAADTPVYYEWIEHINFIRYANAAAFISEMRGLTLQKTNPVTGMTVDVPGEDLIAESNIDNDLSPWANLAVLAGLLVALRLLTLVGLKLAYRNSWM